MADPEVLEVTIGPQGRLVVPVLLRRRLGLEPGDVLMARAEENRLVFERREEILARLRDLFSAVPADVSLADELIAQRREESKREQTP